jgi:hypothetical protein
MQSMLNTTLLRWYAGFEQSEHCISYEKSVEYL